MTENNKLDPIEKADTIKILCGDNFNSVVQLMHYCNSQIHNLNANAFKMRNKFNKIKFYGDCRYFKDSHQIQENIGNALYEIVKKSNNGELYKGAVSRGCLELSKYFACLAEEIHYIEEHCQ